MSTHSPAFVDAFRLLLNDLCGYLAEADLLATQYAEWSVADSEAARDLVLVNRGSPGAHDPVTRYVCPQAEACPGCGATSGVQPQPAPPTVQARTCPACGMEWAITCVNPQVRPVDLAELLGAARCTLRQVVALAEQGDRLTDEQLRDRLTTLAEPGKPVTRPRWWAVSPLDGAVHLVPEGGAHPPGGLNASCGAVLPVAAIQHDQPPPGPPCESCRVLFLADFTATPSTRPAAG
ncbi:MAG: hypothetical protein ACRDTA_00305 [Pseudonocardiaceae bacterium]